MRAAILAALAACAALPVLAQETFTYTYGDYTAELPVNPQRFALTAADLVHDFEAAIEVLAKADAQ